MVGITGVNVFEASESSLSGLKVSVFKLSFIDLTA